MTFFHKMLTWFRFLILYCSLVTETPWLWSTVSTSFALFQICVSQVVIYVSPSYNKCKSQLKTITSSLFYYKGTYSCFIWTVGTTPTDAIFDLNSWLIIKLINEEFYSYLQMTDGSLNLYWQTAFAGFFFFKQSLYNLLNFTQKTYKSEKTALLLSKFQSF